MLGPIFNAYSASQLSYITDGTEVSSILATSILSGMIFVAEILTFISAVRTFSFLHDKRCVDMFGSLPCDRGTMCLAHLAGGVTGICVPYAVTAVLVLAMSGGSPDTIGENLLIILFTLIMIIATYSFTALISYCCGTTADTVIISLVINGAWMLLVLLYYVFMDGLVPDTSYDSMLNTPVLILFAPYAFGYFGEWATLNNTFELLEGASALFAVTLVWEIIFTAGITAGAYFAAKKRRAESAQNGFSVAWLPMGIQAVVSLVVGTLAGLLFAVSSLNGDFSCMVVYAFWYVVMSAIAFVIAQIIFQRGVRGKWRRGAAVYAGTAVVSLGIVFAMCFGLGIDTYVPSAGNVRAVALEDGELILTQEEDVENVIELHQIFADNLHSAFDYPYYFGSDTSNVSGIYSTYADFSQDYPLLSDFDISFEYSRKFGTAVTREYDIYDFYNVLTAEELDRAEEIVREIYSSDAYKEYDCAYLFDDETRAAVDENIKSVVVSAYYLETSYYYDDYGSYADYSEYEYYDSVDLDCGDTEFMDELYSALRADVQADEEYIPASKISDELADSIGDTYYTIGFYSGNSYSYADYTAVIKSSYANTMNVLAQRISFGDYGNYNDYDVGNYI